MSDLLERANRFYAVAAELEQDAKFTLACADMLNRHADALSEANMRAVKPPVDQVTEPK